MIIKPGRRETADNGVTLVETLVALSIAGFVIAGLVTGFVQAAKQTESSAYILAAQALATQGLEQTRAAKWDPTGSTGVVDQLIATNFPMVVTNLDVPGSNSRLVYATNRTTISVISTNPQLRMIQVDCSWMFPSSGRIYTNSIYTYRAPDQ
jgi:type II secretory pathway pseudopilin PulG